ncbi:response regulator [Cohnella nanjingensis]|uniref:Response regulator n=1 Tax=Cohnella nanjingensis TaxID=1387779 RepID=A0A7X0VGG5_9BACL|nr:response regulator [Cohnella nanjingensis]MBB6671634.1 response regulator [Cohnella nanjingensis]
MYQVLLVDDDRIDLEGLVRLIPWERLRMQVCAVASDAYEALDLAAVHPVDILVTDIKMPIMTGLELAERIVKLYPAVSILFVSAYEDFHFAKQAIALNASGYVTKPYDNRELVSALERIQGELDKERQRQPMLVGETIRQWLEGMLDRQAFAAGLREYGLTLGARHPAVAIAEMDDLWQINADPAHPFHGRIGEAAWQIVRACGEAGMPLACPLDNHRVAVVLDRPDYAEALTELVKTVEAREPFTITVGIGAPVEDGDVRGSYLQAAEALTCKLFYGKNRTIDIRMAKSNNHQSNASDLDGLFEGLFVAASGYDLPRIDDGVEALFRYAAELNGRIRANHFAMFVLSKLDAYLNTLNVELLDLPGTDWQAFDVLARLETIAEMKIWFRRRMFEASELLHKRKLKKGRLIEEVEAFVRERLSDRLTLRDVADRFAFSPNYFGQMFREETGEKFNDFLTRLRIEKARELLRDPKLKVFEVAHQVGFKKIANFSVQFKMAYGLSPGDYRKQC